MFNCLAKVGTLCLHDVVATPIELYAKVYRAMNGGHYRVDATYDAAERVVDALTSPTP